MILLGYLLPLSAQQKKLSDTTYLQPVEVNAVRAADKAPFAKTNMAKKEIEKNNLGQDLPFLLNQTPSVVVNSDAGTGIGYTGIHIRGTDATRINITLNGIPYNDAESQGTYFVDLPDFASSLNSIQVQRGVGTSSNGAGAFGASVNLATNEINKDFYAELNNSYGSFNSWKNTFKFGSGIIGHHFTFDARLSRITSDGYIDRAATDLRSIYTSAAWLSENNSLRLNILSGKEKTYQAWYGVPENLLDSNRTFNPAGMDQPGKPYDNETDNYKQTHYQLFFNHQFNKFWKANLAVFLTKGAGYYEEYRAGQALSDYGLPDYYDGSSNITKTDLIRRLWLDNNFYGSIFSLQHDKNKSQFILGGGWNEYDGKHYGEVIWAQVKAAVPANYHWYDLTAFKNDFNIFGKWTEQWSKHILSYADLQFRNVNYTLHGFAANPSLFIEKNYFFFNPKFGLTYNTQSWQIYGSIALAGKEPNRDDFEASNAQQPRPEQLTDLEFGVEKKTTLYSVGVNGYYMSYKDQLVLTGKINDVGSYTRTNIPSSYRKGVELQGKLMPARWVDISANITFSENKIKDYTEYIDDYDNGGQQTHFYNKSDISFSPSVIAGATLDIMPFKNSVISLISKYVGRQYLDNTSHISRSLNSFYVQDVLLSYQVNGKVFRATQFIARFNNIFNRKYEPNGYTYSYFSGGALNTQNYYFPISPFNFMIGLNIKI